jgi:hypothetical protein
MYSYTQVPFARAAIGYFEQLGLGFLAQNRLKKSKIRSFFVFSQT